MSSSDKNMPLEKSKSQKTAKRSRIGEGTSISQETSHSGDEFQNRCVPDLASIKPRRISFEDDDSLLDHGHIDCQKEYDLLSNLDDDTLLDCHEQHHLHSDSDGDDLLDNYSIHNEIMCTTNFEQSYVPSASDGHSLLDCHSVDGDMICTINSEQYYVPSDSDDDDVMNYDNVEAQIISAYNIGQPNCICQYCGALMWCEERLKASPKRSPKFSLCCSQGDIEIAPYTRLPQPLYDLYHGCDRRSRFFLDNIRSFNSMFAFTSIGGNIDKSSNKGRAPPVFVMNGENYHRIGSLLPLPGQQPKFAYSRNLEFHIVRT